MATLWRRRSSEGGEATWEAHAVSGGDMSGVFAGAAGADAAVTLATFGSGSEVGTAILASGDAAIWVNGETVVGGVKVLQHRDEILVGRELYCYSAHSRPAVMVFALPAGERRPRCAVCRMAVEDGQTVGSCPQCGRVYHQIEAEGERPAKLCFTYRPQCLCGHPTSLDENDAWRPDKEECDD